MAAAHGGQLVLSQYSATLIEPTLEKDVDLLDLGEHRLRGLAQPERVYQLSISGLRARFPPLQSLDAFPATLPPPGPSLPRLDEEFAGREVELARRETAWQRALAGTRQVALVAGEPGIGKTRLAAELARRAHGDEIVLYGRCDEDVGVAFQPFVEALRPYAQSVGPEQVAGDVSATYARLPETAGVARTVSSRALVASTFGLSPSATTVVRPCPFTAYSLPSPPAAP